MFWRSSRLAARSPFVYRKVRQKPNESIQVFAERLLALGEDAVEGIGDKFVERQMVGFFIDGLYKDQMKLKIMRANPLRLMTR